MKDISSIKKSKETIIGLRVNKESLYYSILFGVATLVAIVLMIFAFSHNNPGLKIYSCILTPIFAVLSAIAIRFTVMSKDKIHVVDGVLVIKSFFCTRKIKVADIEKLTAAKFGTKGLTSVNITYCGKTAKYIYKNMTKEEIALLRRSTSKY